ncbi:MAG: S8 family serine peptidase [Trebonia sp.]
MAKRRGLSVLAGPATASALLGGVLTLLAAVPSLAAGAASAAPARAATSPPAATPPRNAGEPVIVIMKAQAGQTAAWSAAARASSAAVTAAQAPLISELRQAHATRIKRFTLVNAVAATVSPAEAQRLTADPAVQQVIRDQTFTVPAPTAQETRPGAAAPSRPAAPRPNVIPGACAPGNESELAPEGLALTRTASGNTVSGSPVSGSTVSGNTGTPTARSLGFTGAGVKVAYIADGLDQDNVNFKRQNGTSVFTDYQDFTGNGPDAPTAGGEAFLDANTIAGQGIHVYQVNGFSAASYPGTACDIKIEGVAPGASLAGLDVFSADQGDLLAATTSMIAQAINYAVETDKVNVLNESFGGNALPDTAQDVIKLFDDAAVKAGVVVSVSSGDAGTANTIGSPATDPNVISVGASTQFQALAQANVGGTRYFATKGWLSDNISSFSSAGFDETGGTVDLVAPGDLSWASCDANAARYAECVSDLGNPSDIEVAGGTSESAPFVSGAAALVIQAFRKTHGGRTPTPAQVKQILLSTATDLGVPAQEEGAGLLDSYQAVQLAESYGSSARTGSTLLASAGQLTEAAMPGTAKTWKVTVTNEGTRTQAVTLSARTLNPASTSFAGGSVTLSATGDGQYTAGSGVKVNYATFKFTVPAGQARLDVSIAYPANPGKVTLPPNLALFDPDGRVAADSEPQGVGNYGNVDVRAPAAGEWTAVVSGYPAADGGYNGKVAWQEATQNFGALGSVSPASLSLAPGQAKSFAFSVRAPAEPGDLAGSVLLHSSGSGVTSIPVIVRSLVNVAAGGAFTGDLTGGNGRGPLAAGAYYQFTVPPGAKAVRAELKLHDNPGAGNLVGAYLVGPDGNVLGYGQNTDRSGAQRGLSGQTLTADALNPVSGGWTLVVAFTEPTAGTEVSDPYTGNVTFAPAGAEVPSRPLPDGTALPPGNAVTIPVTITNQSNAPQDYYLDPRLRALSPMTLAPFVDGTGAPFAAGSGQMRLPLSANATTPLYFVPSGTSSITVRQAASGPAMTDLSTATGGDPDIGPAGLATGSMCGTSASETYTPPGGTVTSGNWATASTECGPCRLAAPAVTATDTVTVTTAGFDRTVAVATGDFEQLALSAAAGSTAIDRAVEIQPGKSATVNVTFRAAGTAGATVAGTLYLDALQAGVPPYGQLAGDEVAALPYSYKVG